MTTESSSSCALTSDISIAPGPGRYVGTKELERQERSPERHPLESPLDAPTERTVGRERREEPEAVACRRCEARLLHRPEHGARAHVEDPLVALPAHSRRDRKLTVVKDVEGVRLEEDDPPAWPDDTRHRRERRGHVVEVVEREEPDRGVESAVERLRQLEDVDAVEGDFVAAGVERCETVEERPRQVDSLNGEPALGERQRVAAHSAPDVEEVIARRKAGEPDERLHLPLDVRRRGRPHRLLPRLLEVLDLAAVVLSDVGSRHACTRPPSHSKTVTPAVARRRLRAQARRTARSYARSRPSACAASVKEPRTCARAASPSRARNVASSWRRTIQSAISAGSSGATSMPVSRCLTCSGTPPTAVAITGRPAAIASSVDSGKPSDRDASTNTLQRARAEPTGARPSSLSDSRNGGAAALCSIVSSKSSSPQSRCWPRCSKRSPGRSARASSAADRNMSVPFVRLT